MQRHAAIFFGGGGSNSQRGVIGVKIFDRDENSRLMACHYRQAITKETTQEISYKHVMCDSFVAESKPATMYCRLLPMMFYTNKNIHNSISP